MSQKIVTTLGLILFILLFIAGLWAFTAYSTISPQKISQHETSILIQDDLTLGSLTQPAIVMLGYRDFIPEIVF